MMRGSCSGCTRRRPTLLPEQMLLLRNALFQRRDQNTLRQKAHRRAIRSTTTTPVAARFCRSITTGLTCHYGDACMFLHADNSEDRARARTASDFRLAQLSDAAGPSLSGAGIAIGGQEPPCSQTSGTTKVAVLVRRALWSGRCSIKKGLCSLVAILLMWMYKSGSSGPRTSQTNGITEDLNHQNALRRSRNFTRGWITATDALGYSLAWLVCRAGSVLPSWFVNKVMFPSRRSQQ